MRSLEHILAELDRFTPDSRGARAGRVLLCLAEETLERWIEARGGAPTLDTREGFRLLALHRQGAQDMPSFNACRETCREIVYHYNLLEADPDGATAQCQRMMAFLVRHLALFVAGKLRVERLGEFCCASRPLREPA